MPYHAMLFTLSSSLWAAQAYALEIQVPTILASLAYVFTCSFSAELFMSLARVQSNRSNTEIMQCHALVPGMKHLILVSWTMEVRHDGAT